MKTVLLLVTLACLLSGCTASTRDGNSTVRSPGLHSPPESSALQLRPAPQEQPRPVVYFAGGFAKTGAFAWTNGMTLKDGIDVAGGFTKWANGRLRLIHRDGSKELYLLGPGRTLTNNLALKPEDLVFVREEVLAL